MRFLLLVLLFNLSYAKAQAVLRIISLPTHTPNPSTFFAAGSFNGWNPSDTIYQFKQVGDFYEVTIPLQQTTIEYKITGGSWAQCEAKADGTPIANRVYQASANETIEIEILGWEKKATSTALANVQEITIPFNLHQPGDTRKVWIYLPSEYDQKQNQFYPVLYMHDGQNVFDAATSFSGEWGVDEILAKNEQKGQPSCIVVAVENGGSNRLNEYSPYYNEQYQAGGMGNDYVDFLVHILKPFIDSTYRIIKDKEHTFIAGSSMGGLISFYAAAKYPEVYGKAGAFSPSFWFSDSLYQYVNQQPINETTHWYFVAGTQESGKMAAKIAQMVSLLKRKGCSDKMMVVKMEPLGQHNEQFWNKEFASFYEWLIKQ